MKTFALAILSVVFLCGSAHATIDPVADDAHGTLSAGINSTDTSLVATTGVGTKFPSTFPYTITIFNCTDYGVSLLDPSRERVRVTNRISDTFTITRGQEGTSAVNHNTAGKTYCIQQSFTKAMVDAIRTDIANAGGAINDVVDATVYATLNDAITALCALAPAVKTLRISNAQTVSSNITVCPTVTVWVIGSGTISINNSVTLTVKAPLVAPVRTLFLGSGTVAGLTFSRGEWFGCARDGSADDTACLQKASDSIASIGGQLNLGIGTYRITASLTIGSFVKMEGFGPAATFIKGALTTSLIKSPNTNNHYSLWHFKDFTVDNTAKTNAGGVCINQTNIDDSLMENVHVQNCETGVLVDATSGQVAANNTWQKVTCLTATTCFRINRAEWLTTYSIRSNNGVQCMDIDASSYVTHFAPKCEAFTNGARLGATTVTDHTHFFTPTMKNTPTVGTAFTVGAGTTNTTIYDAIYVGTTTQIVNSSTLGQLTVFATGNFAGIVGISNSLSPAYNLNGSCTFAAAATCAVTFGQNQNDTSYKIQLGCGANKTFWWSAKAVGGFTINASSSSSDVCDWWISR